MVTALVEVGRRKCHQYWPKQIRGIETYGSFTVELIQEQAVAHYTLREIKVTLKGGDSRTIRQMQYMSWPDHGVPRKSFKTEIMKAARRALCRLRFFNPEAVGMAVAWP